MANGKREIWPNHTYEWPDISISIILGCGSITSPKENTHPNEQQADQEKGATHLLQIIITESAHLLWVLRCKRVIREKTHSNREIRSRWQLAIKVRLTDDKITATKIKREEKFTNLIKATWEPMLHKLEEPPENWLNNSEVFSR